MTDLDNTQIIGADESLLENASTIETEAALKIVSGADPTTHHIGKETIIGRSNPSTLVISAPSLSKQHAKINFNNGQYFITDLGSSNKTFHNKIQLQPNVCYALHDGDEIKLGDLVCSFEEQKPSAKVADTLSEPSNQAYVPVVNTLVEDDSPWHNDDDDDDDLSVPPIVEETKVDAIPSTQTITDSYDDQEPTQPMKIWNGNSSHVNRLSRASVKSSDDVTSKSNGGGNEPSINGSSSFIPSVTSAKHTDDHDDGSLMIGSSTLPATVPLLIESTQINNEDQLEIVSSVHTKQTIEEDDQTVTIEKTTTTITTTIIETDIQNTQAYTLEPGEEIPSSENQIGETQAYELEGEPLITDIIETKQKEVHKVVIDGDTMIEKITTTKTTTTAIVETENPPLATLAYDLEPMHLEAKVAPSTVFADTQAYDLDEQIESSSSESVDPTPVSAKSAEPTNAADDLADRATTQERVEITITRDSPQETLPNEDMETEGANPLTTAATDEPIITTIVEEDVTSTSTDKHRVRAKNEEESAVSATDDEEMAIDESTPKVNDGVALNQSATISSSEPESKIDEVPTAAAQDESATSTLGAEPEDEEEQEEEEEKEAPEETGAVSGRGQRGMARRNVRRARGRSRRGGAAARARVVSTRIYGGRRNAVVPATVGNDENNATLEETIQTETEESPKKASQPPAEEETKSEDTQPIPATPEVPTKETARPSQDTSGSNVRVSARIKARASSGRNRQFPYTDDYVDLDDLEKQSKTSTAAAATAAPPVATTTRKPSRGGRGSATPQKRISLRQQPIDASASPDEKSAKGKDQVDVYEDMDMGGENEEPDLSTSRTAAGRKRKSTTPVAAAASTKRTRSTTPQTAPTNSTRRKQTSDPEPDPLSFSDTTTPKRARKSTKASTPAAPSPSKAAASTDRPVRIALSSHLNFEAQHLEVLRKLGFEIMDESCHVDALVVDRIRRTKKFFMCLARGAHILSPTWIEAMIKENRYIPYDEYYLEDTSAETRYGFQLRESVRLAKERPVFEGCIIFCTKETSPPYDDLKDIVEAAGGKFIEKINRNKPGKDLVCIVAQTHKNEYEDLFKKGVPIVSEEFALSGISKQKLDYESFSLFQNAAATAKTAGTK